MKSQNARTLLSRRVFYAGWFVGSAGALAIARAIDAYVFGYAAFGAVSVSGLLVVGTAILHRPVLLWAVGSAVPSVLALLLLSAHHWA